MTMVSKQLWRDLLACIASKSAVLTQFNAGGDQT